ncbi:hypothetical protein GLW04_10930 [Halobacillus litoralis]|uniref:Uncharacterized protein n=1 Tax=Halobacillus litoralis TaxID=45668 RepID=A0A845DV82_9BACI|nr:hypothetical protein [Halobacillus litoralis]MYL20405.1 hypothetical protein [Halobacillus litoralis]
MAVEKACVNQLELSACRVERARSAYRQVLAAGTASAELGEESLSILKNAQGAFAPGGKKEKSL